MTDISSLLQQCAPMVAPVTMRAIVRTESSFNAFAIGVVGGHLIRQPRSLAEAVATAQSLDAQHINFSVGLSQVNRSNLQRFGLTYQTAFDPCSNLQAGSAILRDCFTRANAVKGQGSAASNAAISCYYSGNFTTGLRRDSTGNSYVQRVAANVKPDDGSDVMPAIPVVTDGQRKPTVSVPPDLKSSTVIKAHADFRSPDARHPDWDAFGEFDCDADSCGPDRRP